ncbi:related to integral membrane protein [Ramularia collo-cygni]|uniref:GDP-mannose transporter n=1 Tax=Ramularia collo-cygni TaxID=112498 RepID=A0A2D3UVF8_9PEZI|nr:related to integral membrane protein [Ramularia collo-cygni]CZT19258.1 related to integral membrane protein [Ramularia collo-cygni]
MSDSGHRDSNEELRYSNEEKRAFLLPIVEYEQPEKVLPVAVGLSHRFWFSTAVNTVCTALIVFLNKRIFEDASLRHAQVGFAAFHFAITALLLYIISRPQINLFQAKKVDPILILPLALAMIPNVVLPNASLANSSVQFYQVARVLLTPCVAAINYFAYQDEISRKAALTLVPVCLGVAIVSYYDTASTTTNEAEEKKTTPVGVMFALTGVVASSVYTVLIKSYHKKLDCESNQLLLNQAPLGVLVMLYIIPFSDDVTACKSTSLELWGLILLSGICACLINLSQYAIINEGGPVTSTVVGHFKTCFIVSIGWIVSKKSITDGSVLGVVMAVGGIIGYQYVIKPQERK